MNEQENDEVWQFPCIHPIKIMGPARATLLPLSIEIIQRHIPGFLGENIRTTESRTGKYISLTVNVEFKNKTQVDSLFAELAYHQQNGDDISFVI